MHNRGARDPLPASQAGQDPSTSLDPLGFNPSSTPCPNRANLEIPDKMR